MLRSLRGCPALPLYQLEKQIEVSLKRLEKILDRGKAGVR
jgi:hypothetical protein